LLISYISVQPTPRLKFGSSVKTQRLNVPQVPERQKAQRLFTFWFCKSRSFFARTQDTKASLSTKEFWHSSKHLLTHFYSGAPALNIERIDVRLRALVRLSAQGTGIICRGTHEDVNRRHLKIIIWKDSSIKIRNA